MILTETSTVHHEWELAPTDVPVALLRAVGWRVLVRMPAAKKQTDGGIYVPEKAAERESLAVMVGEVVGVGEGAYPPEKFPSGPWCRVGDWVIFRSYSGTRLTWQGREYRLISDDAIEAVTLVPDEIEKAQ